jgi:hypothetical protein
MENPDPTKFIAISDHVSALRLQQAEFDSVIAEKESALSDAAFHVSALSKIESAIVDDKLDAEATVAAARAEIETLKLSGEDKEQAEIRRQIAELQAKLKS